MGGRLPLPRCHACHTSGEQLLHVWHAHPAWQGPLAACQPGVQLNSRMVPAGSAPWDLTSDDCRSVTTHNGATVGSRGMDRWQQCWVNTRLIMGMGDAESSVIERAGAALPQLAISATRCPPLLPPTVHAAHPAAPAAAASAAPAAPQHLPARPRPVGAAASCGACAAPAGR